MNKGKILRTHRFNEFKLIPKSRLLDFLGAPEVSRNDRLLVNRESSLKILATWEAHFRSIGVPYVVEQIGSVLYLWKERRVGSHNNRYRGHKKVRKFDYELSQES